MIIVHFFLRIFYRMVAVTGFFSTGAGLKIYQILYDTFKIFTENREMKSISGYIEADSLVIDVGANVGFCTNYFLKTIGSKGKVAAIEPEILNIKILRKRFAKVIKSEQLILFEKVVADTSGEYHLHIDEFNPGGHMIASEGVPVKGITIDEIVSKIDLIPSLIKIDVEGHEEMVIKGAMKTLEKYHPVLFMEFHPRLLSECGTDYTKFLEHIENIGYKFHIFQNKQFEQVSITQIIEKSLARGWTDILFIPDNNNI